MSETLTKFVFPDVDTDGSGMHLLTSFNLAETDSDVC